MKGRQLPLTPLDTRGQLNNRDRLGSSGAGPLELPMSMYTELLDAAVGQRGSVALLTTRHSALHALRRSSSELTAGMPTTTDPDAVPMILAREIAYDVALLELAELMGIETDLLRFEQPRQGRDRLEQALRDRGVLTRPSIDAPAAACPG